MGSAMHQFNAANFMLRNAVQPVFTGQADDYEAFMADFDTFVAKISGGAKVTDQEMLNYLEPCLPEALRKHITSERQKTKNTYTFAQMKTFLDLRFGDDPTEGARRKWEQVELPKTGRITMMDFLGFEAEFNAARARVKDATDNEARRLVLAKLPISLSKLIFEEEERRNSRDMELEMEGIPGMVREGVIATIRAATGVEPRYVNAKGASTFVIGVKTLLDKDKVLELHGRAIAGTGQTLVVKPIKNEIPFGELFTILRNKLATREKVDARQKTSGARAVRQTRARIAEIDDDDSDDERPAQQAQRGGDKNKGNPKSDGKGRTSSPAVAQNQSSSPSPSVQQAATAGAQMPQSMASAMAPNPQPASGNNGAQTWNRGRGKGQDWSGRGYPTYGYEQQKGGKSYGQKGGKSQGKGQYGNPPVNSWNGQNNWRQPNAWQPNNWWQASRPNAQGIPAISNRGSPAVQNQGKGKGKGAPSQFNRNDTSQVPSTTKGVKGGENYQQVEGGFTLLVPQQ